MLWLQGATITSKPCKLEVWEGKRWKGEHGCKQYLDSYHSLHHHYGLQREVSIAFWWDTPTNRRSRQELELSLILKWRSPFNKENWERWGQPFS